VGFVNHISFLVKTFSVTIGLFQLIVVQCIYDCVSLHVFCTLILMRNIIFSLYSKYIGKIARKGPVEHIVSEVK